MFNFTPQPLYRRTITLVPVEYEAGLVPEPLWIFWRNVKSFAHVGVRTQKSFFKLLHCLNRIYSFLILNVMVYKVTTGFRGVKVTRGEVEWQAVVHTFD